MAAYDGGRMPDPDKDPTKETQWELQGISKDIGKAILETIANLTEAAKKALEESIKEIVDTIVGYVTNPASFLADLAMWAQRVPLLSEITQLLFAGWIPGLDASKIISGQFPQAMISGLTQFLSAIPGGNIIGQLLASVIPGLDASKITTGTFGNGLIPGLTQVINDIFGKLTGLGGSGWTNANAAAALESQAQIAASNAAAIALLQSKINSQGGPQNVDANEDFEFNARPDLGVNWARRVPVGIGSWGTDGHNAVHLDNGMERNVSYNRIITPGMAESATDFQLVGIVLDTSMEGTDFFFEEAFNTLLLAMNPAMDTMVRVRFGTSNVRIEAVVNDVVTQIGPIESLPSRPSAGSALFGAAGTIQGIRYYQAIYNGSPILTVKDDARITKRGLGFRGWGFGGMAGSRGLGQSTPGAVRTFAASDSDAGGGDGGETTGLYLKQSVSKPNIYTTNAGGGLMLKPKASNPKIWETVSSGGFLIEADPVNHNLYHTM